MTPLKPQRPLPCRRWTKAMEQWRGFHNDMQELTAWLDDAEAQLTAAKNSQDAASAESALVVSSVTSAVST